MALFIRPLLTSRRDDLRQYLIARGESFCEDSVQSQLAVPRNQVRHRLLPVIEDIAPGGIVALARFAALGRGGREVSDCRSRWRPAQAATRAARGRGENSTPLPDRPIGCRCHAWIAVRPSGAGWCGGRWKWSGPGRLCGVACRGGAQAGRRRPVRRGHLDLPGVKVDRRGTALTFHGFRGSEGSEVPRFARSRSVPESWNSGSWHRSSKCLCRSRAAIECLRRTADQRWRRSATLVDLGGRRRGACCRPVRSRCR